MFKKPRKWFFWVFLFALGILSLPVRADDTQPQSDDASLELEKRFHGAKRKKGDAEPQPLPVAQQKEDEEEPLPAESPAKKRKKQTLYQTPEPKKQSGPTGTATLEDYRLEGSFKYRDAFIDGLNLGAKAGVVSGLSLLGGPNIPFATLLPSPHVTASASYRASGKYGDTAIVGTAGYLRLNTQQAFAPNEKEDMPNLSEDMVSRSLYADYILPLRLSSNFAVAPFVGISPWGMTGLGGAEFGTSASRDEGNFGVAAALKVADSDTVRAWFQGELTLERPDSFRNDVPGGFFGQNLDLFLDGVYGGADYTHRFDPTSSVRAWAQYTEKDLYQRAEWGVDAWQDRLMVSAAGRYQDTNSPWFTNEAGGAAKVEYRPLDEVGINVSGFGLGRTDYAGQDLPANFGVMGGLTWTPGANRSGIRAKKYIARQIGDEPDPQAMIERRRNLSEISLEFSNTFRQALENSETFAEFSKSLPARTTRDIIQAVSLMTDSQPIDNYNFNEGDVINAGSTEELYQRWRETRLTGEEDPMLVCIGSAQSAVDLAETMGKRAGIPIDGAVIGLTRRSPEGKTGGHAAALLATPEYGFVFVDWGEIIATNTRDPDIAMEIYQARQGTFAVIHTIGEGERGAYAGYKITEQGKAVLRAMSFHGEDELPRPRTQELFNDDYSGSGVTRERALDVLDETLRK